MRIWPRPAPPTRRLAASTGRGTATERAEVEARTVRIEGEQCRPALARTRGRPSPHPHTPGHRPVKGGSGTRSRQSGTVSQLPTDVPQVPFVPASPHPPAHPEVPRYRAGRRAGAPTASRAALTRERYRSRLEGPAHGGNAVSDRVPQGRDLAADEGPRGRPRRAAVLRPARLRRSPPGRAAETLLHRPPPRHRRARASRWWSTGGRRVRCRSTGPAGASRWASRLRRRFGFTRGELTAYEDERLPPRRAAERAQHILEAEIERPRFGPMRDIVATIQPEQDVIVRGRPRRHRLRPGRARAPARPRSACTGRRTCSTPTGSGCARRACSWSGRTLASCATSATCCPRSARSTPGRRRSRSWSPRSRRPRPTTPRPSACSRATPGWRRCCAARSGPTCGPPTEALVVPRGSRRWRVPAYLVDESCRELRAAACGTAPAGDAAAADRARRCWSGWRRPATSPDDRVQDAVARSRPVQAVVDARVAGGRPGEAGVPAADRRRTCWPARRRDPRRRTSSGAAAGGRARRAARRRPAGRSPTRCWSTRPPTWSSARRASATSCWTRRRTCRRCMLRAVGRRCSTGSATVLGDLAQGTTPWATRRWDDALGHWASPARTSRSYRGLPGARRGDRVRRPAAADDRARARAAAPRCDGRR